MGSNLKLALIISSWMLVALPASANPTETDPFSSLVTQVETRTGARLSQGNFLELLVDGPSFWPVRLEMLRNARRSIDLITFLWCDDEVGYAVVDEMIAAKNRGVRVRVIVDFLNRMPHEVSYRRLRQAGIPVLVYTPPRWDLDRIWSRAVHEKMLIVDGAEILMGGANVCDEYMIPTAPAFMHDQELHAKGPVLETIQKRYDQTWNWMVKKELASLQDSRPASMHAYKRATPVETTIAGDANALFLYQQSYMDPSHGEAYSDSIRMLIESAKEKIVIYAPYFIIHKTLEKAYLDARKRGIDITVFTNAPSVNDEMAAVSVAYDYYAPAMAAGIHMREYNRRPLHFKGILVDDRIAWLGSHNFTPRSFMTNGESMILTDHPPVIEKFKQTIEHDLTHDSILVTPEAFRNAVGNVPTQILILLGNLFKFVI